MITWNEWLDAIKGDIKRKYNIEKPIFLFDGNILQGEALTSWLKKYADMEGDTVLQNDVPKFWIKYKRVKHDVECGAFELKPFSPDPDDAISNAIIHSFLNSLEDGPFLEDDPSLRGTFFHEEGTKFGVGLARDNFFSGSVYTISERDLCGKSGVIVGDSFYSDDEVRVELLYLFRIGKSKISFNRAPFFDQETKKLVHSLLVEEDTLENLTKSGLLKLEYF